MRNLFLSYVKLYVTRHFLVPTAERRDFGNDYGDLRLAYEAGSRQCIDLLRSTLALYQSYQVPELRREQQGIM